MGIIEELAALRSAVDACAKALGRHSRVPESRWATVTAASPQETRVQYPGESGEAIITRSTEAVWVGAQVLVQQQGSDRWIVGLSGATIPAGSVTYYGGPTAPPGWVVCDGRSLDRATYWRLYGAIGTTYGAADSASFAVPDLSGRSPVGLRTEWEQTDTLGKRGGQTTHYHDGNSMRAAIGVSGGRLESISYAATAVGNMYQTVGAYTLVGSSYTSENRAFNHHTAVYGDTSPAWSWHPYTVLLPIIKF